MVAFLATITQRRGNKMKNKMKLKYIFEPNGDELKFVGDFESLYINNEDPWNQSGRAGQMSNYYSHSRKRLVEKLKNINPESLLEVGCGLGYSTKNIQESLPDCNITGVDISKTAIMKAGELFPSLEFINSDIRDKDFTLDTKYDVVVLSQLLWYILESLPETLTNCLSILKPNGRVIISQAFLKTPQKYGKDICDGFCGLIDYLIVNKYDILYHHLDNFDSLIHDDGLVVFRKEG